ncbi:MAG: AAA family ATPase [Burkholderiaceae bacterium]
MAYIFNPKLTANDLLETICHEFGVAVSAAGPGPATIKEHLDPLNKHLLQCHAQGLHSVLIVDEAQCLTPEVLEQLRLLTNLETNERKLLQIILIGQPELRQMLARPALEQLAQRVIARFHLGALTEVETRQYVAHRLAVAGWQGPLPMTEKALRQVHRLTGGVPRRINLLCDRAMLGAYATGASTIDHRLMNQAAAEVFDRPGAEPHSERFQRPAWRWASLALAAALGALALWGATRWQGSNGAPATLSQPAPDALPATPVAATPSPALAVELPAAPAPNSAPNLASLPPGPPPVGALITDEDQAFAALGTFWNQDLSEENPCGDARQAGLQCYRIARMTANGLRQFDRPALLKLHIGGQGSGYVLATAITDQAVELRVDQQRWRMPLSALGSFWSGYYATLWRTPPGQQGRLTSGYNGPAAAWLAKQLGVLQAKGDIPADARTLKQKVEAFQRANGLDANGAASPTTLILINRAAGVEEPRLTRVSP